MLFHIIQVALLLVIGVTIWRTERLRSYIERNHPETWERLGRPTFRMRGGYFNYIYSKMALGTFVISSSYRTLNDRQLTKMITWARLLMFVGVLLAIALFIADPHGLGAFR